MSFKKITACGSRKLNFQVVPGLNQPDEVAENTIWVETETVNRWYFSSTQPDGMQENDVWFQTDTESSVEFNALKKNNLTVYPLSAKQMVSGALEDVTAKTYQEGKWVAWWNGELYDTGKQYELQTGGWEFNPNFTVRGLANPDHRASFNSDHIYVTEPSIVSTKKKIDLSSYTKLCFDVNALDSDGGDRYGVLAKNSGEAFNDSSVYAAYTDSPNSGRQTIELDISSLNSSYYVVVCTSNHNRRVYKIWMK